MDKPDYIKIDAKNYYDFRDGFAPDAEQEYDWLSESSALEDWPDRWDRFRRNAGSN